MKKLLIFTAFLGYTVNAIAQIELSVLQINEKQISITATGAVTSPAPAPYIYILYLDGLLEAPSVNSILDFSGGFTVGNVQIPYASSSTAGQILLKTSGIPIPLGNITGTITITFVQDIVFANSTGNVELGYSNSNHFIHGVWNRVELSPCGNSNGSECCQVFQQTGLLDFDIIELSAPGTYAFKFGYYPGKQMIVPGSTCTKTVGAFSWDFGEGQTGLDSNYIEHTFTLPENCQAQFSFPVTLCVWYSAPGHSPDEWESCSFTKTLSFTNPALLSDNFPELGVPDQCCGAITLGQLQNYCCENFKNNGILDFVATPGAIPGDLTLNFPYEVGDSMEYAPPGLTDCQAQIAGWSWDLGNGYTEENISQVNASFSIPEDCIGELVYPVTLCVWFGDPDAPDLAWNCSLTKEVVVYNPNLLGSNFQELGMPDECCDEGGETAESDCCTNFIETEQISILANPTANPGEYQLIYHQQVGNYLGYVDPDTGAECKYQIQGWTWNFGDGSQVNNMGIVNHTFAFPSSCAGEVTFPVSLCVWLADNPNVPAFSCSITQDITITHPNPALVNTDFQIVPTHVGCTAYNFTVEPTSGFGMPIANPQWNFGDGSIAEGTEVAHTFPAPGTYSIVLTDGNLAEPCPVELTLEVTGQPTADFSFFSDCVETQMPFFIPDYNPNYTYTWDFNGTMENADDSATAFDFGTPGIYPVSLTAIDANGCTQTSSQNVSAASIAAIFTIPTAICVNEPLTISGVLDGGTIYTWDFGTGPVQEQSPTFSFSEPGDYTISLTVVSANGCINQETKKIRVYDAGLSIATPYCGSQTFKIAGSEGTVATIDFGNGTVITDASLPYTFTYPESGLFTLSVQSSDPPCQNNLTETVVVGTGFTNLTIEGPTVLCPGTSETLSGVLSNPLPGHTYSYSWSNGETGLSTTVTEGGFYVLTVTSEGICSQELSASYFLPELPNPTAIVAAIAGETCPSIADGSVTLEFAPDLLAHGFTINGQPGPENSNTLTIDNLASGNHTFTIALDEPNTCASNLTVNVPYIGPQVQVSSTVSKCDPVDGTATVSASGGSGNFEYEWYTLEDPNTIISTATQIGPVAPGNYTVLVRDLDLNCEITKTVNVPTLALTVSLVDPDLVACNGIGNTTTAELVVGYNYPQSYAPDLDIVWNLVTPTGNLLPLNMLFNSMEAELNVGNYEVHLHDDESGCDAVFSFSIEPVIQVQINNTQPFCPDDLGILEVIADGGSGNYAYAWNIPNNVGNPQGGGDTPIITEVPANTSYSVTITDLNDGCKRILSGVLTASTPSLVNLQSATIDGCDLLVGVTGGSPPFHFQWYQEVETVQFITNDDPPPFVHANTVTQTQLVHTHYGSGPSVTTTSGPFETGTYTLVITDANGCSRSFTKYLVKPVDPPFPTFKFAWKRSAPEEPSEPGSEIDPIVRENMAEAKNNLFTKFTDCVLEQQATLGNLIQDNCRNLATFEDQLTLQYEETLHHYTLYYYDRAGQLNKTVPPQGVDVLDNTEIAQIKAFRENGTPLAPEEYRPDHLMETHYRYNSLGQLVWQETPDSGDEDSRGQTNFLYDDNSRLRFSQNAQQAIDGTFSYTHYDALGRIIEVGLGNLGANDYAEFSELAADVNAAGFPVTGNTEVTRTRYTDPVPDVYYLGDPEQPQRYLQNRVSCVCIDEDGDFDNTPFDQYCTYYSYDPHGNVEWLVQKDPVIGPSYLAYDYDLISGNVLNVKYNEHRADRFFHRYVYDPENRIDSVFTSRDGVIWQNDASYEYYLHGPLARTVIGENHVSGMDYIYTIHGWLKGINTPSLDEGIDPGQDGTSLDITATAKDAFGMSLGYYQGDFVRSGSFLNQMNGLYEGNTPGARDLYNGNISHWTHSQIEKTENDPSYTELDTRASLYTYDLLNRIKSSFNYQQDQNVWTSLVDNYRTAYTYDGNGNIQSLQRYDGANTTMDDLAYTYPPPASQDGYNNQLQSVIDYVDHLPDDKGDLIDTHVYTYDAIGNLTSDAGSENLDLENDGIFQEYGVTLEIDWTVYGKVKQVDKTISDGDVIVQTERIRFRYDPNGNRVLKEYSVDDAGLGSYSEEDVKTTYYVRDVAGMSMGIYQRSNTGTGLYTATLKLIEHPIYGSDRLGVDQQELELTSVDYQGGDIELLLAVDADNEAFTWQSGFNRYEQKDHLGNVRVLLTDQKVGELDGNTLAGLHLEVVGYWDYYPFGMGMKERIFEEGVFRFGFNSVEKENTINGKGNSLDFGERFYNNRLGKWFSLDSYKEKYPSLSPYSFAGSNPIVNIDINGDSIWTTVDYIKTGENKLQEIRTIHTTITLLNLSHDIHNMNQFASQMEKQMIETLSKDGLTNSDGDNLIYNSDVKITVANNMNDVPVSDNLIVIVDDITGDGIFFPVLGLANKYSQIAYVHTTSMFLFRDFDDMVNTAIHEWGHNAGLGHLNDSQNFMYEGINPFASKNTFNSEQLNRIFLFGGSFDEVLHRMGGKNAGENVLNQLENYEKANINGTNNYSTNEKPYKTKVKKGQKIPTTIDN